MLYCCLVNSGLLSVILFNCFYSQPDLSALLKRVETLETQSRPDISTHMRQLSSYNPMVYEVKLISINIMPSLWLKLQRSKPIVRRIQKHIFLTRHVKPSAQACHDPQPFQSLFSGLVQRQRLY